jgi:uncharacterized protein YlzI (FlbEa/FlbD family)
MLKKLLIITLLTLVSVSTYSQRIRTIGSDTFVTFTRQQAKAINDTFVSQKNSIARLKAQDSISLLNGKQLVAQDSIRKVKDSITYYNQLLPELAEIKKLLVSQIETPFKRNIEIGAGVGASTYFGNFRPFSEVANGKYYIPMGFAVLKYNFHKHLTAKFEVSTTKVFADILNKQITQGSILADYNIAPNIYSIRVGMIPIVTVGYDLIGKSIIGGASIKGYFTKNIALEINVRGTMVNIDNIGANDYLFTGGISITKRIL